MTCKFRAFSHSPTLSHSPTVRFSVPLPQVRLRRVQERGRCRLCYQDHEHDQALSPPLPPFLSVEGCAAPIRALKSQSLRIRTGDVKFAPICCACVLRCFGAQEEGLPQRRSRPFWAQARLSPCRLFGKPIRCNKSSQDKKTNEASWERELTGAKGEVISTSLVPGRCEPLHWQP